MVINKITNNKNQGKVATDVVEGRDGLGGENTPSSGQQPGKIDFGEIGPGQHVHQPHQDRRQVFLTLKIKSIFKCHLKLRINLIKFI